MQFLAMILFQGLQITFSSLMTIPLRKWVDQGAVDKADSEGGTEMNQSEETLGERVEAVARDQAKKDENMIA